MISKIYNPNIFNLHTIDLKQQFQLQKILFLCVFFSIFFSFPNLQSSWHDNCEGQHLVFILLTMKIIDHHLLLERIKQVIAVIVYKILIENGQDDIKCSAIFLYMQVVTPVLHLEIFQLLNVNYVNYYLVSCWLVLHYVFIG